MIDRSENIQILGSQFVADEGTIIPADKLKIQIGLENLVLLNSVILVLSTLVETFGTTEPEKIQESQPLEVVQKKK